MAEEMLLSAQTRTLLWPLQGKVSCWATCEYSTLPGTLPASKVSLDDLLLSPMEDTPSGAQLSYSTLLTQFLLDCSLAQTPTRIRADIKVDLQNLNIEAIKLKLFLTVNRANQKTAYNQVLQEQFDYALAKIDEVENRQILIKTVLTDTSELHLELRRVHWV